MMQKLNEITNEKHQTNTEQQYDNNPKWENIFKEKHKFIMLEMQKKFKYRDL